MTTQRQDSLSEQMGDVMKATVEMGCYDAHDWLMRVYGGMQDPWEAVLDVKGNQAERQRADV